MECRNGNTRPFLSFPPPGCNYERISGPPEQYNLSPLLPHTWRRYLPYSYSTSIHASSSQQMTRKTPSHSLYPGYKSGLRTPIQRRFSLELACCSNSVSHSNKLYFPFILSHVWKFFSNPHTDHDKNVSLFPPRGSGHSS